MKEDINPKTTLRYTLPKSEILRSTTKIQELFSKDSSYITLYPLRIVYRASVSIDETPQVLFSVSKKKFKRAVDRNHVKRRMREAYRLHKHLFFTPDFRPELLGIIYISKEKPTYQLIEHKLIKVFEQINS